MGSKRRDSGARSEPQASGGGPPQQAHATAGAQRRSGGGGPSRQAPRQRARSGRRRAEAAPARLASEAPPGRAEVPRTARRAAETALAAAVPAGRLMSAFVSYAGGAHSVSGSDLCAETDGIYGRTGSGGAGGRNPLQGRRRGTRRMGRRCREGAAGVGRAGVPFRSLLPPSGAIGGGGTGIAR